MHLKILGGNYKIKMEDKRFGLGVFVCVFNKDFSKIMLIKRNKKKRKRWGSDWGNVGGIVEFGELLIDACIREAREEIGVNLNPEKLKLIEIKETPDFLPEIHFVYAASVDENTEIIINHESEEYRWFDMKNLPDRMIDSKAEILGWWKRAKNGL